MIRIEDYLATGYTFLQSVSRNICGGNGVKVDDLLSELILFLYSGKKTVAPYLINDIVCKTYCINRLSTQNKWSNSEFNNLYSDPIDSTQYQIDISNTQLQQDFELTEDELSLVKNVLNLKGNVNTPTQNTGDQAASSSNIV